MTKLIPLALLAALTLGAACTKNVETTVAGTDEEMLERYSSRREELRGRLSADESLPCNDKCKFASEVCDIAKKTCDIAGKDPDDARRQSACVSSNEDCARFNDACGSCKG